MKGIIKNIIVVLILCLAGSVQAQNNATQSVTWKVADAFADETADVNLSDKEFNTANDEVTISFGKFYSYEPYFKYSDKSIILRSSNYITFKVKEGYVMTKIEFSISSGYIMVVTSSTVSDAVPSYDRVANGYIITSSATNNTGWTMSKDNVDMPVNRISLFRGSENCTFTSVTVTYKKAEALSETLNITGAHYATYFNKNRYFMPTGCSGYTISIDENNKLTKSLKYPAGACVPPNKPLLIYSKEVGEHTLYTSSTTKGVSMTVGETLLKGDLEETEHNVDTDGEGKFYQLSYNSDGTNLGFYWQKDSNNGSRIINGANKCYLFIPTSANSSQVRVSGFSLDDIEDEEEHKDVTAIHFTTNNDTYPHDDKLYNLQGQLVDEAYRGIVIKNGIKILNK